MILVGWNLDEVKGCNLPQKVQKYFTSGFIGAEYEPIAYLGSQQVVNGMNYRILALMRTATPNVEKRIVKMIIREDPDGLPRFVSVSKIAL